MVKVVQQRGSGDCGVAALSTLLSWTDHDYDAVAAKAPRKGQTGLRTRELVATARRLGLVLTPVRAYDLDVDSGILRVRSHVHHREGHWVAIRYQLVWDPRTGYAEPWRAYAARYRARFGMLARVSASAA